ncbi:MAG: hypothetical protein BGO36_16760 [Burkholderiales bacterium 68-10]|nr:MAG: hypothetical protein BGO36_16760 [Burkholderiales bacterium 68-10]
MRAESAPPLDKRHFDVRTMNLAQLQRLAERGSRRARAELEARMRAPDERPAPAEPVAPALAPVAAPPAWPAAAQIPTLTVRVDPVPAGATAGAATANPPAPTPAPAAIAVPHEALARQLQLIARQDEARARAGGPPRLVGLVLLAWGALLLLGGLVMLGRGGVALYYLCCGLGAAAVGALLMRRSRWAMALHGALLLLALGWAWAGAARHSLLLALIQAAPLLIPAAWMAVRAVREPLE